MLLPWRRCGGMAIVAAVLLTLAVGVGPAQADGIGATGTGANGTRADAARDEDLIRRVLRVVPAMKRTDPTTQRRIETVLTGEALYQWQQGRILLEGGEPDLVRLLDDGTAVAHYLRLGRVPYDLYAYMTNDPVWRLSALRRMDRADMVAEAKSRLEAVWFRDSEQNARLENFRLTLATDRELRQWFVAHRQEMDALVNTYRQAGPLPVATASAAPSLFEDGPAPSAPPPTPAQQAVLADVAARCEALHLKGVSILPVEEAPGTEEQTPLQVTIGGVMEDAVGFVHAPAGPPLISPERYIWVDPLGGDWYLVRTT